jgi:hypothetical protein
MNNSPKNHSPGIKRRRPARPRLINSITGPNSAPAHSANASSSRAASVPNLIPIRTVHRITPNNRRGRLRRPINHINLNIKQFPHHRQAGPFPRSGRQYLRDIRFANTTANIA